MNHPPHPFHLCSNCFEMRSNHVGAKESCLFAPTTFKLLLFTPHSDASAENADMIRRELGVFPSANQQLLGVFPPREPG